MSKRHAEFNGTDKTDFSIDLEQNSLEFWCQEMGSFIWFLSIISRLFMNVGNIVVITSSQEAPTGVPYQSTCIVNEYLKHLMNLTSNYTYNTANIVHCLSIESILQCLDT